MEILLVADTNLFFECMPLKDLPWDELDHDPVVVLLTKPVLDEIDHHKNATGRTRDRALEIFQIIRKMIETSTNEFEIRASGPRVTLRHSPIIAPDQRLNEKLDYRRNDDKLIGILSTIIDSEANIRAALITNDIGPASTARALNIPIMMIDQSWRRPIKETAQDKKIRELTAELQSYRAQEPKIEIGNCRPADEDDLVLVEQRVVQSLTEAEINELIDALRSKHPMQTDFTPPPGSSGTASDGSISQEAHFEPPSDEEIQSYQRSRYPKWIEKCREILSELHVGRSDRDLPIILEWPISNNGTRPATKVLVQFSALGPLRMRRMPVGEDGSEVTLDNMKNDAATQDPFPTLPQPPKPPTAKRIVRQVTIESEAKGVTIDIPYSPDFTAINRISDMVKKVERVRAEQDHFYNQGRSISEFLEQNRSAISMAQKLAGSSTFADSLRDSVLSEPLYNQLEPTLLTNPRIFPQGHDSESFYYDWPLHADVKEGALTCDLWRHTKEIEIFRFAVFFTEQGEAEGAVRCTVHAENLSKPEKSTVKIKRATNKSSLFEIAKSMIADLA